MDDKFLTALGRICIAVVCLPLHIIIIWLFNTKQEYKKHTAFKIMTFLGVADSLHLIAQLMTASMVIWHLHTHPIFERISGALVLSTWDGMVGMIFVLALNRVVMVTQLSMTVSGQKTFFFALSSVIWVSYISIVGLHLTEQGAVEFAIQHGCYNYRNTPLNQYLKRFEVYGILLLLSLSLLCYFGIVVWIAFVKNIRSQHVRIEKREMRILAQGAVVFVYMSLLRCVWAFGSSWYRNQPVVVVVLALLSCFIGGINPLLYLCFNSGLRAHFFAIFGVRTAANGGKSATVSVFHIFTTRKEYRKYVAFKIMTGLGIIDVLHLTGQFMAGCMIVFKLDVGAVYERVTGCLLMSMWCGMTGMNFVLATNRVIVLTQTKIRIIRAETLFYVLSGIAWSTYVSVICIHLTDEAAIDYKLHYKSSFGYRDTTLNSYMMSIESGWILTTLLLSFVCYIGIVLWLLFNKKLNVQHVKIERRELRILAQAIIVFAYMGANRSIWQFALRLVISAAIYTDIMVVLSCMIGMVNPLIYLYFNSGVRNQVLTFVGLKAMASSESSTIRVVTVKSLHRISF
ncbi:hypothetical protein QR680_016317 [Steinernema hermaphroditum]|uniref:G-protein coupled receptors family 1 profile domain-containing protein n=1 Tax=Steinernema hermaphroditum TaxID=289476 RepID=A0AA39HBT0_9BILA|nr:hypothetical protein QR680_016317 [Steinernema hermaphroditum]